MADYAILITGQLGLKSFEDLSARIEQSAVRAVNKAADRGRTEAARKIRAQIAFPASYVGPGQGRLVVSRRARKGSLEAAIRAQSRATSLARFVTSIDKTGARVQVAPGASKFIPKAFLVRLNQGASRTDTKFNKGLAIRLKPGETLRNKKDAIRLARGLYLLYGPSVQQAFINNAGAGVALDISPDVAEFLEREYLRQVDLDGI